MTTITVSITLNVSDETEFRNAAFAQGMADGLDQDDAKQYLDSESKSLGECAAMILDPGVSPAGSDILGSDWDEISD